LKEVSAHVMPCSKTSFSSTNLAEGAADDEGSDYDAQRGWANSTYK
jgi:hypothetical protein